MGALRYIAIAVLGAAWCGRACAAPLGQWIWSPRDLAVFRRAQEVRPDVEAAVHVADLAWAGSARVRLRVAPPPLRALRAIAVRLDGSFDSAWSSSSDEQVGASVAEALRRVLAVSRDAGYPRRAIQIDYDCPVRHLSRYARVLRQLAAPGAVLEGREVWVTTLASHLRQPSFGALFGGAVTGHIVQLFDTGERFTPESERSLAAAIARAAIPFRVGVGAFERTGRAGVHTDHLAWASCAGRLGASPLFRGTWVFAAGLDWSTLAEQLP